MAELYGFAKMKSFQDWEAIVGSAKWKPGNSAHELAKRWLRNDDKLPGSLATILLESSYFGKLSFKYGFAESPEYLDNYKAPSMTDLMAICTNSSDQEVLICVEGKCNESFDDPVKIWLRTRVVDRKKIVTGEIELTTENKKELLSILAVDTVVEYKRKPLMLALTATTASLVRCFAGEAKRVIYPKVNPEGFVSTSRV